MTTPPVIVLSYGRSGSSMLSDALHAMGVQMWPGPERENNAEDHAFQAINTLVLLRDRISIWVPRTLTKAEVVRAHSTFSEFAARVERPARWGFKDPRTALTWRAWRFVYPDARWIHLVRDGRDVALSMVRRENHPPKPDDPEGFAWSFRIWEGVMAERLEAESTLGGSCVRVHYENLTAGGAVAATEWGLVRSMAGLPDGPVPSAPRRRKPRDVGPWEEAIAAVSGSWALAELGYVT